MGGHQNRVKIYIYDFLDTISWEEQQNPDYINNATTFYFYSHVIFLIFSQEIGQFFSRKCDFGAPFGPHTVAAAPPPPPPWLRH